MSHRSLSPSAARALAWIATVLFILWFLYFIFSAWNCQAYQGADWMHRMIFPGYLLVFVVVLYVAAIAFGIVPAADCCEPACQPAC